jgi:hypothetical protein
MTRSNFVIRRLFKKGGQNEKSQSVYFCRNVVIVSYHFISAGPRTTAAADG